MRSAARRPGALISPRGGAAFRSSPVGTRAFATRTFSSTLYNGVMARGDRVVAVSEQIAQLVIDRYGTPWQRIAVVPSSIDFDALRSGRGRARARRGDASRLGRQARHQNDPDRRPHRAPQGPSCGGEGGAAAQGRGLQGFLCASSSARIAAAPVTPASFGIWCWPPAPWTSSAWRRRSPTCRRPMPRLRVVVSAAVQPEGLQRSILEAQAMARPVIVSDLGAGPDIVLTPPAVLDNRITGLRFARRRRRGAGGDFAAAVLPARAGPPRHGRARPRLGARPFQRGGGRRADSAAL